MEHSYICFRLFARKKPSRMVFLAQKPFFFAREKFSYFVQKKKQLFFIKVILLDMKVTNILEENNAQEMDSELCNHATAVISLKEIFTGFNVLTSKKVIKSDEVMLCFLDAWHS